MNDRPLVSLVISTVGRPAELRLLLHSIPAAAQRTPVEVVVVDQSPEGNCEAVLSSETWTFPWRYLPSSDRGASRGRNVGLAVARGSLVGFPDDSSLYLERVLDGFADLFLDRPATAIISGQLVTPSGKRSMIPFPRRPTLVHRLNVIRCAIESAVFMRISLTKELGGFDEALGAGSTGWWGAGEVTDLLLRALEKGERIDFEPELHIIHEDHRPGASASYRRKMLLYGCGMGEVLRRHRLPAWYLGLRISRRLVRIASEVARGRAGEAVASSMWLRGLIAGWRGVPPRELCALRP